MIKIVAAVLGRFPRPSRHPRLARPGPVPAGVLPGARRAALAAVAVLVAAASVTSFAESYRGLYGWATGHGLAGVWAAGWPLQVDVFIAVGELALFVGLADGWERRSRVGAWAVTLAGLAVSVAGNVGHAAVHTLADRATAAVPPLAAASALAVGLGVLKRVVGRHRQAAEISMAHGDLGPLDSPEIGRSHADLGAVPAVPEAPAPGPAPEPQNAQSEALTAMNGHANGAGVPGVPVLDALSPFAADLAAGQAPSIRRIRAELRVGQDRATEVQAYLRTLARTPQ